MVPPGQVPGRHHAVGGEEPLVADHPVAEGQPGVLEPAGGRSHPDAHHHHVGHEGRPVVEVDHRGATLTVGVDAVDADPEPEGHTVVPVEPGADLPHPVADHPAQRGGERLDHGDVGTEAAAGGGHLGADEAGADDHHAWPVPGGGQVVLDGQRVVEGPEHVDVGQSVGAGEPVGGGTRGHHQPAVVEVGAVLQAHHPAVGVEAGGPHPQPEVEAQGVEHVGGVVVDAEDVPLAGQELLGQRRPVVGGVDLVAHDDHLAGVPLVADLLGRPQAGQRRPHHHHRGTGLHRGAHRPNIAIHWSGVPRRKT